MLNYQRVKLVLHQSGLTAYGKVIFHIREVDESNHRLDDIGQNAGNPLAFANILGIDLSLCNS
jgi:hypothetical protein